MSDNSQYWRCSDDPYPMTKRIEYKHTPNTTQDKTEKIYVLVHTNQDLEPAKDCFNRTFIYFQNIISGSLLTHVLIGVDDKNGGIICYEIVLEERVRMKKRKRLGRYNKESMILYVTKTQRTDVIKFCDNQIGKKFNNAAYIWNYLPGLNLCPFTERNKYFCVPLVYDTLVYAKIINPKRCVVKTRSYPTVFLCCILGCRPEKTLVNPDGCQLTVQGLVDLIKSKSSKLLWTSVSGDIRKYSNKKLKKHKKKRQHHQPTKDIVFSSDGRIFG
jgi:hypothetical protein